METLFLSWTRICARWCVLSSGFLYTNVVYQTDLFTTLLSWLFTKREISYIEIRALFYSHLLVCFTWLYFSDLPFKQGLCFFLHVIFPFTYLAIFQCLHTFFIRLSGQHLWAVAVERTFNFCGIRSLDRLLTLPCVFFFQVHRSVVTHSVLLSFAEMRHQWDFALNEVLCVSLWDFREKKTRTKRPMRNWC